jgi:hypothetical protein
MTACVRVESVRSCKAGSGERSEPHEGGPMARLGRGQSPRLCSLHTTTNYILVLDSSSIGCQSKDNISLFVGCCDA